MALSSEVSKERLLALIDELKDKPNDKLRLLGDVGIVSFTATGAPMASVAAITCVKSVFGLSAAAKLFGLMPALLITGPSVTILLFCASGLGMLAYAVTRLIHGGGVAEGRKTELLINCQDRVKQIEAKERSATITDEDRNNFIISLRALIDADEMQIASAFKMIELVESGRMPLSQAVLLANSVSKK